MSEAQERILEIDVTCDEGDDEVVVTGVRYYRTRAKQKDSDGFDLVHTAGAAAAAAEVELGQVAPPPTHIRINSTFQA